MGGDPLDFAELSFFELDRLFTRSALALRRKQQRRRRREKENQIGGDAQPGSCSRSRSAPRKRRNAAVIASLGGFSGSVEKVERTVIVLGVPPAADEKILFGHFSKCGTVSDVRILRNRQDSFTGTVIVEFAEDMAVTRACTLPPPHNEILSKAVVVKRADAQLNKSTPGPKRVMTRQQVTQHVLSGLKMGGANEASGPNMRKLHIKNLRPVVTEEDMQGIFKSFGEFETFQMGSQECWITFQNHKDAQDAMGAMQGFQLVGLELQISMMAVTPPPPPSIPPPPPVEPAGLDLKTDSDFGATGNSSTALHNRIELMKKLLASHSQVGVPTVVGLSAPGAPAAVNPSPAAALPPTAKPGTPVSRSLLLQNMFTPSSVNLRKEPKFYEEIREDTHDECAKFGKVLHVTVDPRGSTGLIYILYETPQQRAAAEIALNGRWFEGKKIIAMGIDDSIWQALAAQATAAPVPGPAA